MLTQAEFKKYYTYNPENGLFSKIFSNTRQDYIGKNVGYIHRTGYLNIIFKGKTYAAHRLAYLFMTGLFPVNDIDHINRIKNDNRWCNLKSCTHLENMQNMGNRINNTSGKKGVYYHKRDSVWQVIITNMGISKYYGSFKEFKDACKMKDDISLKYAKEAMSAKAAV